MINVPRLRRVRQVAGFCSAWQILCLAVIGLSVLVVFDSAMAEEASFQEKLKNATILNNFETDGAYVKQVKVAQNRISFLLWKEDSSIVAVYDLDGCLIFRKATLPKNNGKFTGVDLTRDGNTLIVNEVTALRRIDKKVFDVNGSLRFKLEDSPALHASPSGKYFCSAFDEVLGKPLSLFDSNGDEINCNVKPSAWNCRFLDDERLLIIDPDSAWIVQLQTGRVIESFVLNLDDPFPPFMPKIGISEFDSSVAIYTRNSILVLSVGGKEIWRKTFDDILRIVNFDDLSSWIALLFEMPEESAGYIKFILLDDENIEIKSPSMSTLGRNLTRYDEVSWLSNHILTIWGPVSSSFWQLNGNVDHWTMFFEIDIESRTIGQPIKMPGLFRSVTDLHSQPRYLHCIPNIGTTILSIEDDKKETEE